MEWILLLIIGLIAGTIGSLIGLGGGIIIVPSLLLMAGFDPRFQMITPQIAVGTSLFLIIFTSLASTLTYAKQKRVDFESGLLFFVGSGPGAIFGAYITRFFHSGYFLIAFGLFMIFISILMYVQKRVTIPAMRLDVKRTFQDASGEVFHYGYHRITALIVSFFVGVLSGMFGIGGGTLMVPMMVLLFRFPPHVATATSMFVIFLSAITGSAMHIWQGNVFWFAALFLAPGAWLGGQLGAYISARLSSRALLLLFRLALVLIAIQMIMDGVNSL